MRYRVVAAIAYVAALTWFAYASDDVLADWVVMTAVFVAPFAVGFMVGRLWAVTLPGMVVLLAAPAGQGSGEIPIYVAMLFVGLVAVPAIVIGWGARWLRTRYASRGGAR